jgi:sporulation protein YabP
MGEQKLSLEDRSRLLVTGVSQVLRFEEELVVLETNLGMLHVHGRELKLQDLSLEGSRAAVTGEVSALIFEEPRERSLLGRLLR